MKAKMSPVLALWLLITLTLVIFVGISFSDDIKIGRHTLTKAYFPDTLLAENDLEDKDEDTLQIQPLDSIEMSQTVVEPLHPDTTIRSVLVFGDSMTHHLSMSIAKYGTKNNYHVTGVSWESSSIPGWAYSGKIKEYIKLSKPDFIIVSLGSNEMELKSFERRIPDIQNLVEQLDTIPYVWVGPPLWKEDKGVYSMLEKSLPAGRLFRTEGIDIERGPDHIHPTKRGADVWADTLMNWIGESYHPILHNRPDSGTTTKGHKIIYLHPGD